VRRFPDVQVLLVRHLEQTLGAGHVGIETPTDLDGALPFVRVRRVGGLSDLLNDFSTVDVDVFAGLYAAAELLAEQIRQDLVGPPPPLALLDRVSCVNAPRELPWGDGATVRRFGATYTAVARRHTAA
jgi:hypothetical protein